MYAELQVYIYTHIHIYTSTHDKYIIPVYILPVSTPNIEWDEMDR